MRPGPGVAPDLPDYDDLPEIPGLGVRHAWDVFGRADRLGSINLVTDERVAAAARLVTTGERVSLDLPLDVPDPPLFGRRAYRRVAFRLNRNEMDDRLDDFHLQGSTQWDALSHVRCREHGFWGGRLDDPVDGPNGLGIEPWVEHGIAGRGILVDVAAHLSATGDYDPLDNRPVTVEEIDATLDRQGVTPRTGDIWCIRTGWPAAYLGLDPAARRAYAEAPRFAGLQADEAMARRLWNAHPAAVACDNPAVERMPGDPAVGSLHRRLLPTLGMALGEMFNLETLAARCRAEARWSFFFVAVPLRLPDAIGSPGNAMALL
ncbi:MAG: cyclase family protein [Acidimicrobiales bacterium]